MQGHKTSPWQCRERTGRGLRHSQARGSGCMHGSQHCLPWGMRRGLHPGGGEEGAGGMVSAGCSLYSVTLAGSPALSPVTRVGIMAWWGRDGVEWDLNARGWDEVGGAGSDAWGGLGQDEVRWDGTGWDTSDDGMGLERMGQQWVHRLPVVGHREVHGPVNTQ